MLAQAQHELFKCVRVGSARVGELDLDLPERAALQALDSGDGELDEHGLQAYRSCSKYPAECASQLDMTRITRRASQVLALLTDLDDRPAMDEKTTNVMVARIPKQ